MADDERLLTLGASDFYRSRMAEDFGPRTLDLIRRRWRSILRWRRSFVDGRPTVPLPHDET